MKTTILIFVIIALIAVFAIAVDQSGQNEDHGGLHIEVNENEEAKAHFMPYHGQHGGNWQNQPWTGQHWGNAPWNGFHFPAQPGDVNTMWQLPSDFNTHHHGAFNPWGPQYNDFTRPSYNYGDRFAYQYFTKNGFTVRASLTFCNNFHISYIISSSRSLTKFCKTINSEYGPEAIPTFPKVPETSE